MTESEAIRKPWPRLGAVAALLIACAIARLACWLLLLPLPAPSHLTPLEPRPALLDKPHRYLPAASASAQGR